LGAAVLLSGCGGSSTKTATTPVSPNAVAGLLLHYESRIGSESKLVTIASAGGRLSITRPGKFQLYEDDTLYQCSTTQCKVRATGKVAHEYEIDLFGDYIAPEEASLILKLPRIRAPKRNVGGVPSDCVVADYAATQWLQCVASHQKYLTISQVGKTREAASVLIRLISAQTEVPQSLLKLPHPI